MTAPPNVLILMSDQHNKSMMGCAGDSIVHTPRLDQLAAQGSLLENAYCNFPLCVPSRMSFMTGQYPYELGIYSNYDQLPSDTPTFAYAFSAAQYQTILSG